MGRNADLTKFIGITCAILIVEDCNLLAVITECTTSYFLECPRTSRNSKVEITRNYCAHTRAAFPYVSISKRSSRMKNRNLLMTCMSLCSGLFIPSSVLFRAEAFARNRQMTISDSFKSSGNPPLSKLCVLRNWS